MSQPQHHPFESEEIHAPLNAEWAEKRRLAQAIQKLTEVAITSSPPSTAIATIADQIEAAAEALAENPRFFGRMAFAKTESHGSYGFVSHEINPIIGHANPIAPPVNMWIDGEIVRATATMDWAFEGPPGCVHGGFVAAVFDQVLGFTQVLTKQPGVTGTLTTRFIKPTPLCTELRMEARVDRVEGRKNFISGEMYAGDLLTASCEGLFLHIPSERFKNLGNEATSE